MSILIRGMEMPTDCAMLLKIFPDGSVGVPVHLNWIGTLVVNDAEAVPVPPHGRLIDADALRVYMLNEHYNYREVVSYSDIVETPTIIPASEEGE